MTGPLLTPDEVEAGWSPCPSPELALPANTPADLRSAFDLLCWAVGWANRVLRLSPPDNHFEITRQNLVGRMERGETEWLTFAERGGVRPGVLGADSPVDYGCDGWEFDELNSPDPVIDLAAQQLAHATWAWCEAVEAFRVVEGELEVALPGGGFSAAIRAVGHIAGGCLSALGLSATAPTEGPRTTLRLPSMVCYPVAPSVPVDRLTDSFHRLTPIPPVILSEARTQVLAVAHRRAIDEKTAALVTQLARTVRGGRVRGKPKTTDAVDGLMMKMFSENQEECLAYSADQWAEILKCSKSTVQATATWEAIRNLRAGRRPAGGGKRRNGKSMSSWGDED